MKLLLKYLATFLISCCLFQACDDYEIGRQQDSSFVKYYGTPFNDYGVDIKQTPDGGYIVISTMSVVGRGLDIGVMVLDRFGNSKVPLRNYGGLYDDIPSALQLLPDEGFVVIGHSQQVRSGNSDIYLLRFNQKADTLWTKRFGREENDVGLHILLNKKNDLVCIGYTGVRTGTSVENAIWLYSLGLDGQPRWASERVTRIPGLNLTGKAIAETTNGYIILGTSGSSQTAGAVNNIILFRTSMEGLPASGLATIGGSDDDDATAIAVLPNGDILIAGTTFNSIAGGSDVLLARYSPTLEQQWLKTYGFSGDESGNRLRVSEEKVHIVGTTFTLGRTSSRMLLLTTDLQGNQPAFLDYHLIDQMEGLGFDITTDGGYIFTGGSQTSNKSKIVVAKTKKAGAF